MFKSIYKVGLMTTLLLFVLSGCTQYRVLDNNTKEWNKVQTTKERLAIAADEEEFVTTQRTLESTITSLATQMLRNKKMNTNKPIIITSFVRLDQFKKTSEFGRIISESLINELSNRGFNIIEFRGRLAVSVNDKGEYFMTRKSNELKGEIPNTYVVVGTYSRQFGKVIVNTRVIDNITGKIITSARATYQHGKVNDCLIFKDCRPSRNIKIIKEHN
ncbi:MAG: FlgO family outer membrane protein [Poseidonibacter sp.]|uniref:FlgO family outer membrane protein n=1 Tax=Poseidonibacter sp. TaxID=2321188 RepID=UPI00359EAA2A